MLKRKNTSSLYKKKDLLEKKSEKKLKTIIKFKLVNEQSRRVLWNKSSAGFENSPRESIILSNQFLNDFSWSTKF